MIDVNALGKITSDKGKRTWYVYMAEYDEIIKLPKDPKKIDADGTPPLTSHLMLRTPS